MDDFYEEEDERVYYCLLRGRQISREKYETFAGMCQECFEIEIDDIITKMAERG
ncbi:MAG: hypothetical protein QXL91_01840 [Candidatus Bathyarchaeia archaeon]